MRSDARLRRERLVCAAAEMFEREGYNVPLERIAERAQVGRGTLYRNFPDRTSLAIAVIEAHVDELATQIARLGERPKAFFVALRALASLSLATSALAQAIRAEGRDLLAIDRLRSRVDKLFAEPLSRAQAAGLVRDDFEVAEIHLVARMIAGGALDGPARDPAAGVDRALDLLIRGLTPASPGGEACVSDRARDAIA